MTSMGCRSREVDEIKMGLMHLVFWMFNRVFWILFDQKNTMSTRCRSVNEINRKKSNLKSFC